MTSSKFWARLFNLRKDMDDLANVDAQIQNGVDAAGTNLWVLIFAIFIASIGLNVNSTAVIIGAMLISPLMGPIVGLGYGAGVADFDLIRRAARNLALMTGISLLTATIYFTLSPLHSAYSELLARTTPTIWDVLIAFFGGAAGIVAITRKSISNAVPGVAIATALMPPLCTTGFGIANGNWAYAGGAFYLFTINSVFIALATLMFVKIMKLPQKIEIDDGVSLRHRMIIAVVATCTLVPSAVLAYRLVQVEKFQATVRNVLATYAEDSRFVVLGSNIDGKARTVRLVTSGDIDTDVLSHEISGRLKTSGIPDAKIGIRRAGQPTQDMASIQSYVRDQIFAGRDQQLEEARNRVATLEAEVGTYRSRTTVEQSLLSEVSAQFATASHVDVATGWSHDRADPDRRPVLIVQIGGTPSMASGERERLIAGWNTRFPNFKIRIDEHPDLPETPADSASPLEGDVATTKGPAAGSDPAATTEAMTQ